MATTTSAPQTPDTTPPAPAAGDGRGRWWVAALDGLVAGAVAIGLASLLGGVMTWAGLSQGTPSPITALAGAFIDRTPPWLKDFAVSTFGTHDKTALLLGMVVVLVLVSAAAGVLARRHLTAGLVLLVVGGVLAAGAVVSRPGSGGADVVPTFVGVLAGILVLRRLATARAQDPWGTSGLSRRRVLLGAGGLLGVLLGSRLDSGVGSASASRAATPVPKAADPAPAVTGAQLDVPGISPYVVANGDFYRIDTAFVVPHLDASSWSLKVTGEVEQEVSIDWATLAQKPMVDRYITLTCVSNEVGGDLIGNARWTGWPVRELLAQARPKDGADMVLSTSSDGWTAGTPLTALTDERDALLAVAMNGQPLPFEHGFPVRLVVPGLYGYVSATKWVTELKVTRFSQDEGYWTPRGWSAKGPIKTASRIDVPQDGTRVSAGTVAVAGVAWAQHRGISKVEVQVDGGDWQAARLATEPTIDAWRQWVYEWPATSGQHTLTVRAYDASGQPQPATPAPPDPDGAQGYHSIQVSVA